MKVIQIIPEYESMSNMWLAVDEATNEAAVIDLGCFLGNAHKAFADSGATVKYALMTHGHFDHILGVAHAKQELDITSAIHQADAQCLSSSEWNLMDAFGVDHRDFIPIKSDVELKDGDIINIGESELQVMHTPGHSRGSVCFINHKDRIIFSGDTLFFSTVGRTDTLGGDIEEMKTSLKRLLALEGDYDIYPGHGPVTTLSHERVRNIFIRRMDRN